VVKKDAHPLGPRAHGRWRWVEAAGGKFQNSLNLLAPHMKLFDDFFDGRARFQIFKYRGDGHASISEHPRAAPYVGEAFHGRAL
jgi:hypothetical protein